MNVFSIQMIPMTLPLPNNLFFFYLHAQNYDCDSKNYHKQTQHKKKCTKLRYLKVNQSVKYGFINRTLNTFN